SMPPLRNRAKDLENFTQHFLGFFGKQANKPVTQIEDEALDALLKYPWPGNLRELRNILERAVILCEDNTITLLDLPENVRVPSRVRLNGGGTALGDDMTLEE